MKGWSGLRGRYGRGGLPALAMAAAMCLSLTACGGATSGQAGVIGPRLAIGLALDQPLMGYRDGSEYEGFNVEVATYVADRLGYAPWQIVWTEASESDRVSMLDDGDVDLIVGMFVEDDDVFQSSGFDFAGAYATDDQRIMTLDRGDRPVDSPDDLHGRSVCVVAGGDSADGVRRRLGDDVNVLEQPGATQCVTALETGMVDAVSAPGAVLEGLAHAHGATRLRILDEPVASGRFGMALTSGSTQLSGRLDQAVDAMIADGSWERAYRATIGRTGYGLTPVGGNDSAAS